MLLLSTAGAKEEGRKDGRALAVSVFPAALPTSQFTPQPQFSTQVFSVSRPMRLEQVFIFEFWPVSSAGPPLTVDYRFKN
jgi:hypothetical protein